MKRTMPILFGGLSLVVILAIILAYFAIREPRRNLEGFLKEIAAVEIGKTTVEHLRGLMTQAHLSNVVFTCREQDCSFSLRAENMLLHKLLLAPPSIVEASVEFKGAIASEIYIAFVTRGRDERGEYYDDKGIVVRQSTDRPSACHQHYDLSVKQRNGSGDRFWATVAMDSCVSPEDRAKALAINGACLTKIGGCRTLEAIIPQVFARP